MPDPVVEEQPETYAAEADQGCPVEMRDGRACARPIYCAPAGADDRPLCLMHSHDPKKDDAAFQEEFERILRDAGEGTADFTRFVFPTANYREREFKPACAFIAVTFTGPADFSEAVFKRDAYFTYAKFARDAIFFKATFPQGGDFSEATFTEVVIFYWAIFTLNATFFRATFTQIAGFRGATFTQEANFFGATFKHDANFTVARFMQTANFCGARFAKLADFSQAKFVRVADLTRAAFTGAANFSEATFMEDAYFIEGVFTQTAIFTTTTFEREANFHRVTFTGDADFFRATFKQAANLCRTTFSKATRFNEATLEKEADFRWATFKEMSEFREAKFREDGSTQPGPVFGLARFEKPELVTFYKTYLGQALFHDCDVSKFVFSAVRWRQRANGKSMVLEEDNNLDTRQDAAAALRSEGDHPDRRNYTLIAELYQQLKKNYDDRRDYWTAGDFHYGEMEMKRLHSPHRNPILRRLHQNLGFAAWYKYASEYGESYVRPLIWLVGIMALFTILFPIFGLRPNNKSFAPEPTSVKLRPVAGGQMPELSYANLIRYGSTEPGGPCVSYGSLLGHSFMTTIGVAAFQRDLAYEPSYPWGKLLALLETLLTSTMVALFLLAVRRQFRR